MSFGYNKNYKKEWGWTEDLWGRYYTGYRIKSRLYFKNWIALPTAWAGSGRGVRTYRRCIPRLESSSKFDNSIYPSMDIN